MMAASATPSSPRSPERPAPAGREAPRARGICALLLLDSRRSARAAITRALDAMRGPLAGGQAWIAEPTPGLGLGAVAIDDGAHALAASSGSLIVVADARIDNRAELAGRVGVDAGASAAALVLAAYGKWGETCAAHLAGEFAVIVWDGERRRLWCARDGIGHRTLAYRHTGDCVAIASSPRAVPRLDGGAIGLDLDKVAQFLVHAEERDRTFYEGVRHLPPGHVATASAAGLRLQRYWQLEDIRPVRFGSDDAYVEAFRALWRDAVLCRLPERGPAGMMLSAGLDSSTVAATAATLLRPVGGRVLAYHAAPREGFNGVVARGWIADEADDVRAIAALHENIDLEVVRPGGRSFLDGADALFAHACMPPRNADNRHWFEEIIARARARGVSAMLGGFKGNATISYTGIRALRRWAYTGRWRLLLKEAGALAALRGRRTRAILRETVLAGLPAPVDALWRAARGRALPSLLDVLPTPIRPEFAAERRVDEWAAELGLDPRRRDPDNGRRYRMRILGRVGDAADMYRGLRALYGVELLDPTSDMRVVEFCLGIPEQQYLRAGRERQLVRRAMAGQLPERVLQRTTRGAQAPDWHERLGPLRARMADALEDMDGSETVRRCIDVPRLRRLLEHWPAQGSLEAQPDYRSRLTSGIMMGSFIRWFEADRAVPR